MCIRDRGKTLPLILMRSWSLIFVVGVAIGALAAECPNHADRVTTLPFFDTKQSFPCAFSGFLPVREDKSLFYMYFQSDQAPESKPLVVWLQGGPGSSSMLGLFVLNGPIRIQYTASKDFRLYRPKNSWLEVANLLYIDQPAGTGFSFATTDDAYVKNEEQVADDLYVALQEFIKKGINTNTNGKWFFAGESYAGKYVPALTSRVLQNNDKIELGAPKDWVKINVAGALIGNALVHPALQRAAIPAEARGLGYISKLDEINVGSQIDECQEAVGKIDEKSTTLCNNITEYVKVVSGGVDVYDARNYQDIDVSYLDLYLNGKPDFRDQLAHALHVESSPKDVLFRAGDEKVMKEMHDDVSNSSLVFIDDLLKRGTKLLVYNGNFDMLDGPLGPNGWLPLLSAPYGQGFSLSPVSVWRTDVDGVRTVGGNVRVFESLTYITVTLAGHKVPYDQTQKSVRFLETFVTGGSFLDEESDLRDIKCGMLNECSGNGECLENGTCACKKGFGRADCSAGLEPLPGTIDSLGARKWRFYSLSRSAEGQLVEVFNPSDKSTIRAVITRDTFGDDSLFISAATIAPGAVRTLAAQWQGGEELYLAIRNLDYNVEATGVRLVQRSLNPGKGFFEPGAPGFALAIILLLGAIAAVYAKSTFDRRTKVTSTTSLTESLNVV
eukprot:TRINITY_DN9227_c0_g1_i1.p1 TRINITY_DN9227_c0_g1~~TRINITY_DN9227_c0_g1_i1.p1  ORF type:complete len:668 (-),score=121.00 TRINITY_DN9227_c0_g1_i1:71-2074(-)